MGYGVASVKTCTSDSVDSSQQLTTVLGTNRRRAIKLQHLCLLIWAEARQRVVQFRIGKLGFPRAAGSATDVVRLSAECRAEALLSGRYQIVFTLLQSPQPDGRASASRSKW